MGAVPKRSLDPTWRCRGPSKSFISRVRVIIGVTPFRVLITLLISYLPSPLPLQVSPKSYARGFGVASFGRFVVFLMFRAPVPL